MEKNKKIAFLIMAHDKLADLSRMIKKIEHDNFYFYIHVDGKKIISDYERMLITRGKNCILISDDDRVCVNWGGRTQVDAMLILIKYAQTLSKEKFDYFSFLSGADYPISNAKQILDVFNHNDVDFMRIDRIITDENDNKITNLNIHDISIFNHRNYTGLIRLGCYVITSVFRKIKIKTLPSDIKFVHGSAWICLTNSTLEKIMEFIELNEWYYDLFKYSFGSDEVFFHTLAYKFSDKILQNTIGQDNKNKHSNKQYALHYIDWDNTDNKVIGGPKQLSKKDIESIVNYKSKGVIFVRKVDISDEKLTNELDGMAVVND